MCFEQKAHRFLQLRLGAVLIEDEDPLEDRLVELAAHVVARCAVKLVGVAEQLEPSLDEVGADAEVVLDGAESGFEPRPFTFNLRDLLAGLRTGKSAIGDKVNEVVCTCLQASDLALDLFAQLTLGPGLVLERAVNLTMHPLDEVRIELHRSVVLNDFILDEVKGKVARVADPLLFPPAEEVEVLAAELADRALDEHSLVDEPAHGVALAAPQGALQVVGIHPLAFASAAG